MESNFKSVESFEKYLYPRARVLYKAEPQFGNNKKTEHWFGDVEIEAQCMMATFHDKTEEISEVVVKRLADAFNKCVKNKWIEEGVYKRCMSTTNQVGEQLFITSLVIWVYTQYEVRDLNNKLKEVLFFRKDAGGSALENFDKDAL